MNTAAALSARLDILSISMQEILRLVLPLHAGAVAEKIRDRVSDYALTAPMCECVDAAIASELSAQLQALGCC